MGKLRNEQWLLWDYETKSLITDQAQRLFDERYIIAVAFICYFKLAWSLQVLRGLQLLVCE